MAASSATDKRPGGSGSGCVTCLAHSPLGRHAGTCPYICRGGERRCQHRWRGGVPHTLITPGNGDRHRCRIGPCPPVLRLHDAELFALPRACRALPGAWPALHCLEDTLLPSLAALHQPPHCRTATLCAAIVPPRDIMAIRAVIRSHSCQPASNC